MKTCYEIPDSILYLSWQGLISGQKLLPYGNMQGGGRGAVLTAGVWKQFHGEKAWVLLKMPTAETSLRLLL